MGRTTRFRCAKCGYAAEVCGGDDSDFDVRVKTMYCRACRELSDVPVEFRARDFLNDDMLDTDESRLGRCPRCRGADLVAWSAGQPCPRCGGAVAGEGAGGSPSPSRPG